MLIKVVMLPSCSVMSGPKRPRDLHVNKPEGQVYYIILKYKNAETFNVLKEQIAPCTCLAHRIFTLINNVNAAYLKLRSENFFFYNCL